jgi:NAD+ kinase
VKRAGLILHAGRPEASATGRWLAETLAARGVEVWASDDDAARIGSDRVKGAGGLPDDLDLVFVLGGDGTLLRAADAIGRSGVPLLGINFGHLGFLSELERSELEAGLKRLFDDGFSVEERLLLEGDIEEGGKTLSVRAMNDIIVAKTATGRAIRLAVSIGGVPFVSWAADGVIVATATGSTAYSFSAGGPVVSPRLECIIVTPVSPHGLFHRSVVVPADEEVELRVLPDADEAGLSADGLPTVPLGAGARVHIRIGKERVRLAKLEPAPFWRLVREKFHLPAED